MAERLKIALITDKDVPPGATLKFSEILERFSSSPQAYLEAFGECFNISLNGLPSTKVNWVSAIVDRAVHDLLLSGYRVYCHNNLFLSADRDISHYHTWFSRFKSLENSQTSVAAPNPGKRRAPPENKRKEAKKMKLEVSLSSISISSSHVPEEEVMDANVSEEESIRRSNLPNFGQFYSNKDILSVLSGGTVGRDFRKTLYKALFIQGRSFDNFVWFEPCPVLSPYQKSSKKCLIGSYRHRVTFPPYSFLAPLPVLEDLSGMSKDLLLDTFSLETMSRAFICRFFIVAFTRSTVTNASVAAFFPYKTTSPKRWKQFIDRSIAITKRNVPHTPKALPYRLPITHDSDFLPFLVEFDWSKMVYPIKFLVSIKMKGVKRIISQLFSVITSMHRAYIIHGDLTLGNLWFTKTNSVIDVYVVGLESFASDVVATTRNARPVSSILGKEPTMLADYHSLAIILLSFMLRRRTVFDAVEETVELFQWQCMFGKEWVQKHCDESHTYDSNLLRDPVQFGVEHLKKFCWTAPTLITPESVSLLQLLLHPSEVPDEKVVRDMIDKLTP